MSQKVNITEQIKGLYRAPIVRMTDHADKTLVIMSHGFPGSMKAHNDLFGDVELLIAEKGYHALRFDYRGCGKSGGREQDFTIKSAAEDFQNVKLWAKGEGYTRFVYFGEGLGASIAVMNHDLDLACYVMLWPALNIEQYKEGFFGMISLSEEDKARGYVESGKSRLGLPFLEELDKFDLTPFLRDVHVPAMILHGVQDKKIPMECLDLARAHMRSKRLEITGFQDGGHGLTKLNHRKAMFYHIQQFLEKYI